MELMTPQWIAIETVRQIEWEMRLWAFLQWWTIQDEWRGAGECQ